MLAILFTRLWQGSFTRLSVQIFLLRKPLLKQLDSWDHMMCDFSQTHVISQICPPWLRAMCLWPNTQVAQPISVHMRNYWLLQAWFRCADQWEKVTVRCQLRCCSRITYVRTGEYISLKKEQRRFSQWKKMFLRPFPSWLWLEFNLQTGSTDGSALLLFVWLVEVSPWLTEVCNKPSHRSGYRKPSFENIL